MSTLSAADQNDLPDADFGYVEDGGTKDGSGKTVPRSKRHFCITDAAHVRDALARAGGGQSPFADKAMPKIHAAAKKFGITVSGQSSVPDYLVPELRYTPGLVEFRDVEGGKRIAGYGSVFGKLSRNLGGFVENVGESAFNKSRADGFSGVVCRYNHSNDVLLGTVGGGTLQLRIDPGVGLHYDVLPPQSRADILELVQRGDVRHSSFAFRVPPGGDEWSVTDQSYPMRSLREVQLVDVAPVVDPAYSDATAGLRSLAAHMGAPIEDVAALAQSDELRKFFVRSDQPARVPKPVPPKRLFGPAAALRLLERRASPIDDD
jgi:HK97 family phage prohead protease